MAINLQKGQRVDLTKGNPGLSKILVGLGWDPVKEERWRRIFGGLFGGGSRLPILTVMLLSLCLVQMIKFKTIKMSFILEI